jgi:hypothetical protein
MTFPRLPARGLSASVVVIGTLLGPVARADEPEAPQTETHAAAQPVSGKPNVAMVAGGGALTVAGGLALLFGGTSFSLSGASMMRVCHEHLGCHDEVVTAGDRATFQTIGWVGLVSGVALAGTGITLIVVGMKGPQRRQAESRREVRIFAAPSEVDLRLTF